MSQDKNKTKFKKDAGIDAVIQNESDEDNLIDPSEITILDLIKVFGEESVRRGLQYMASLEKAQEEYKKTAQSEELLEGMKNWADTEEPTDDMVEMSNQWSKRMKEEGIGID